ncbi:MAG: hypothetical protein ACRDL8_22855, partial [Solirubrobacteraceae bacterium]
MLSEAAVATVEPIDIDEITRSVLDQIRSDPTLAEAVAERIKGKEAHFAVPSRELLAADEGFADEFKSTARWNVRERTKDRRME